MSTNAVLALSPGDCCFKTVQHEGTPVGTFAEVGGVNTYISLPPTQVDKYDRVILFFADVYGATYINNQLLCDYFASQGFLVLALDYFEGDPLTAHTGDPNFDRTAWVTNKRTRSVELLEPFIAGAREKYGHTNTKYAAVGYCFGAPHTMKLAATDTISAAAFAHPTALDEDHFRNVKQPLFLSCAEVDQRFPLASRHRAEEILIEKQHTFALQLFSGVQHGFAVRCDLSVEQQRWAKEESARSIIGWFNRFCA